MAAKKIYNSQTKQHINAIDLSSVQDKAAWEKYLKQQSLPYSDQAEALRRIKQEIKTSGYAKAEKPWEVQRDILAAQLSRDAYNRQSILNRIFATPGVDDKRIVEKYFTPKKSWMDSISNFVSTAVKIVVGVGIGAGVAGAAGVGSAASSSAGAGATGSYGGAALGGGSGTVGGTAAAGAATGVTATAAPTAASLATIGKTVVGGVKTASTVASGAAAIVSTGVGLKNAFNSSAPGQIADNADDYNYSFGIDRESNDNEAPVVEVTAPEFKTPYLAIAALAAVVIIATR